MVEKRMKVTFPKNINASQQLDYAREALKEELSYGWKIGGIIYSTSQEKTVILYYNDTTCLRL